jgi:Family of unknown function (DUF6491)
MPVADRDILLALESIETTVLSPTRWQSAGRTRKRFKHRPRLPFVALLLATSCSTMLLLSACSGIARRQDGQSQLDRYLQYAGAPVDHFTYLGRFDSWQALSRNQLVVWTSMNDAYLLTVADICTGLLFTERIGVSSTGGSVSRLEAVSFDHQSCPISEIRPLDYRKLRQDAAGNSAAATGGR